MDLMQPGDQLPDSQHQPDNQPQPDPQPPPHQQWSGSTDASTHNNNSYEPPAYAYADLSLYPMPENMPALRIRRLRFSLLRTLVQACFVALPFFGSWLLPAHYAAVYNSYQQ